MKNPKDGDPGLASFDAENEALIENLQNYQGATSSNRDRLARGLAQTFIEFADHARSIAVDGIGIHPRLRDTVTDAIRAYAAGGSFDLTLGGKTTKNPNGRPNKDHRNDKIRVSVALNIDDGSDVLAAATLTSEQLAIGEVDGLPVVTLTPAAIRSIWYAAPLGFLTSEQEQEQETAPLVPADSFEDLKRICLDHSTAYLNHSPQVLKVLAGLSAIDEKKLAQLEHAIKCIAECDGPCAAFHYEKTQPKG